MGLPQVLLYGCWLAIVLSTLFNHSHTISEKLNQVEVYVSVAPKLVIDLLLCGHLPFVLHSYCQYAIKIYISYSDISLRTAEESWLLLCTQSHFIHDWHHPAITNGASSYTIRYPPP